MSMVVRNNGGLFIEPPFKSSNKGYMKIKTPVYFYVRYIYNN